MDFSFFAQMVFLGLNKCLLDIYLGYKHVMQKTMMAKGSLVGSNSWFGLVRFG
jgi:hypothetical protein